MKTGHEHWMQLAISLTEHCAANPFGSVIVDSVNQKLLAQGWNRSAENAIWHGEIDAINQLAKQTDQPDRTALTLYSTAEPCPMCQSAILWTGIETVVFGTSIATLTRLGWNQIAISAAEVCQRTDFRDCELVSGVCEIECDNLFKRAAERKGC